MEDIFIASRMIFFNHSYFVLFIIYLLGFSVLFIPATTSFSAASAKGEKDTATTSVGNSNIISTGTSSNTSNTRISASEIHNDVSGRILSGVSFGIRQWGLALTWREKYAALYIRTMEGEQCTVSILYYYLNLLCC